MREIRCLNNELEILQPYDVKIEMIILNRAIQDSSERVVILEQVTSEMFFLAQHKIIFNCILELNKSEIDFDLIILAENLNKIKKLDYIGGVLYLTQISENYASKSLQVYVNILKEYFLRRQLIVVTSSALTLSKDTKEDVLSLINDLKRQILDLENQTFETNNVVDCKKLSLGITQIIENYRDNKIECIPTHLPTLNRYLGGGFQLTHLTYLAARPKTGKTGLSVKILNNNMNNNIPTMFYSLEQRWSEIAMRMIANNTQINPYKLKGKTKDKLSDYELKQVFEYSNKIYTANNIYLCDVPTWDIHKLKYDIKRNVQKYGLRMVIIDYLQKLKCFDKRINTRREEVAEVSETLKIIAQENNINIFCLAQISRKANENKQKRPSISDLKESGDIEEDADEIIMMYDAFSSGVKNYKYHGKDIDSKDKIELILVQRDGDSGNILTQNTAGIFDFVEVEVNLESPRTEPVPYFNEPKESIIDKW